MIILLKKELEQLEEWQKTLVLMRCQNFKYEDIAAYVDKPTNQLKVYYGRLLKKMTANMNHNIELNKTSV